MKKLLLILPALLQLNFAMAGSSVVSTALSAQITADNPSKRVIRDATDDASEFLAGQGDKQLRSRKLIRAFEVLRAENPDLHVSDLELAEAIVNMK